LILLQNPGKNTLVSEACLPSCKSCRGECRFAYTTGNQTARFGGIP